MSKSKEKVSDNFKVVIQNHLNYVATLNSVFKKKLENPDKNIDDCVTYILNQVKESGVNGFESAEIYGMAMHYYDEEKIEVGGKVNCRVVINEEIKLSPEEIEDLKKQARERVINEEKARLRKKPVADSGFKSTNPETETKSLFD